MLEFETSADSNILVRNYFFLNVTSEGAVLEMSYIIYSSVLLVTK